MDVRISVIMGVYNCGSTLCEALDSMFAQTINSWKFIICDDCSTDDSFEILSDYKKRYPDKIVLIRNSSNLGLNKTLNNCLRIADTEFIARMDGDDISLPSRLEKELFFLDNHHEYSIVSTPMIYFDESGDFSIGTMSGEPDLESFSRGTPFCHAPCMVRKNAYDLVGGYTEKKNRLRVEDWDLWIRMYEQGLRGYNLPEPLYKMRDDRKARKRRKYRYRLNEASVSFYAVSHLKLPVKNYLHVLRPLIVGLLPVPLYNVLHRKKIGSVSHDS